MLWGLAYFVFYGVPWNYIISKVNNIIRSIPETLQSIYLAYDMFDAK